MREIREKSLGKGGSKKPERPARIFRESRYAGGEYGPDIADLQACRSDRGKKGDQGMIHQRHLMIYMLGFGQAFT